MNLTVWECMEMLGKYTKVRVRNGEIALVDEPFNLHDYKAYDYPRDYYEPIMEQVVARVEFLHEYPIIYVRGD